MDDSILIKGGTLLTMDERNSILRSDLLIRGGRITGIGANAKGAQTVIDADGCAVLPGFVQTHLHLCQTIFRGAADDLSLIDWLKKRVWPLEASHSASSVRVSAQLGIAELIKGGTTCALTMETVNHTEQVLQVVEETGFRATVGKCMMDKGDEVPSGLFENTDDSIAESLALLESWHGRDGSRLRYCFAPRFAVSCTSRLLSTVGKLAVEHGVMIHTHASENGDECDLVERESGMRNINYLDSLGLTGKHVALAHCIHLNADELEILSRSQTKVLHCPSSNLKLGSGIAPITEMLERGISVSLGADGAACNNRLDMFTEMRTAALLQKVVHGPQVVPATQTLRLATIEGARALGLEAEIGSLEVGKKADVVIVNLDALHSTPRPTEVTSAIVYAAQPEDVVTVLIDGRVIMKERKLLTLNEETVVGEANRESELLLVRAGLTKQSHS
ncbi:MAG TPA: 5'-deoxyadenosine deaminase [Pyrinomonadaceae bacterium]|nr:5'-deoxyadenosine deaminase [Pyrinomonadaceae bacterium]